MLPFCDAQPEYTVSGYSTKLQKNIQDGSVVMNIELNEWNR